MGATKVVQDKTTGQYLFMNMPVPMRVAIRRPQHRSGHKVHCRRAGLLGIVRPVHRPLLGGSGLSHNRQRGVEPLLRGRAQSPESGKLVVAVTLPGPCLEQHPRQKLLRGEQLHERAHFPGSGTATGRSSNCLAEGHLTHPQTISAPRAGQAPFGARPAVSLPQQTARDVPALQDQTAAHPHCPHERALAF